MKVTITRESNFKTFGELAYGECFTCVDSSCLFMKIPMCSQSGTVVNAVKLTRGSLHTFEDRLKVEECRNVEVVAKK